MKDIVEWIKGIYEVVAFIFTDIICMCDDED